MRLRLPISAAWMAVVMVVMSAAALACQDAASPDEPSAPATSAKDASVGSAPEGVDAAPSPPAAEGGSTDASADARAADPDRGLSAGCGNANAGTGVQSRTITVAGKQRSYVRFIPPAYAPSTPMMLVLALHGSGGTAERARSMVEMEGPAAGKAIFLYPQALPYDPAFPGDNRWNATKGSDDYAFLDALVSEVEASHCIDRDRIFATGFSNGARMVSLLGCYRGDVLRAIAPLAPGGNAQTLPLKDCVGEVGLWAGWGTRDADHEVGSLRVRDHYVAANGCASTSKATAPTGCVAYEGCRSEVPVRWCTYNLDHAWPPIGGAGTMGFFSSFL